MKHIKAKVYVDQSGNSTRYIKYPDGWIKNKGKIPLILYPKDRTDQSTDTEGTYQTIYGVVDDAVYDVLMQDPQCSTPTKAEIIAYQDKHAPQVEQITDQAKVLSITAKVARGKSLNAKEKDALDPLKSESGVEMSKTFLSISKDTYGIS